MGRKLLKKGETPDLFHTELYDKITKIESEVLERIQKLKAKSKFAVCEHFDTTITQCQPYDQNVNYYDKFWKRFLLNEMGRQNLAQLKEKVENFQKRLNKIGSLFEEWEHEIEPLTKTKRKEKKPEPKQQVFCQFCGKGYSDQQSLQIHQKVKHEHVKHEYIRRSQNEDIYEEENDS